MSALKTRVMLFIIAICFTIGVIGIGKGLSSKNSDRHTATAQAKVAIEEVSDSQTGKIAPGYEADLSLFHMDPKEIIFCDSDGNTRKGPRGLVPFMTFLHGQKVWDAKAS